MTNPQDILDSILLDTDFDPEPLAFSLPHEPDDWKLPDLPGREPLDFDADDMYNAPRATYIPNPSR